MIPDCDCGDHKKSTREQPTREQPARDQPTRDQPARDQEIPSFHGIVKKLDKMFRTGGFLDNNPIIIISKL